MISLEKSSRLTRVVIESSEFYVEMSCEPVAWLKGCEEGMERWRTKSVRGDLDFKSLVSYVLWKICGGTLPLLGRMASLVLRLGYHRVALLREANHAK